MDKVNAANSRILSWISFYTLYFSENIGINNKSFGNLLKEC